MYLPLICTVRSQQYTRTFTLHLLLHWTSFYWAFRPKYAADTLQVAEKSQHKCTYLVQTVCFKSSCPQRYSSFQIAKLCSTLQYSVMNQRAMSTDMRQGLQGLFIVCHFISRPAVFKSLIYVETLTKSEFSRNPHKVNVENWKKKTVFQTTHFHLKKYNIFAFS